MSLTFVDIRFQVPLNVMEVNWNHLQISVWNKRLQVVCFDAEIILTLHRSDLFTQHLFSRAEDL